jgi:hypothetical protein
VHSLDTSPEAKSNGEGRPQAINIAFFLRNEAGNFFERGRLVA